MIEQSGIIFEFPTNWNVSEEQGGWTVSPSPPYDAQARVGIRIEKLTVAVAKKIRVLDTLEASVCGCYPAYTVGTLFERPLELGTCVEAEMEPRPGSKLPPARLFVILLSRHLVVIDFRRPVTLARFDGMVRDIAHRTREKSVSVATGRKFAHARREDSKLIRRAQEQWQVFLCHNSKDKPQVRALRDKLFEEGVVAWMDESEIAVGTGFAPKIEEALEHVDAVIVARGPDGFGDWQKLEYGVALNEYIRRNRSGSRSLKIIPVALPGGPPLSEWSGFLGTFNGIEFRSQFTKAELQKLVGEILPGPVVGRV